MQRKILQFDYHNIVCNMEIYRTYTFYGDYEITQNTLPVFKNVQMSVETHDLHPDYKLRWDEKYSPEKIINKLLIKEMKHNNMDAFDIKFIEPELQEFVDKYKNDFVLIRGNKIPKHIFTADSKLWELKIATYAEAIYRNKDAEYYMINFMSGEVVTIKEYNLAFTLRMIKNDEFLTYGTVKDIEDIENEISKNRGENDLD